MRQEVSFGYPRFYSCVRLPEAFRRLSRPSSASQAEPFPRRRSVSGLLSVWILGVRVTFSRTVWATVVLNGVCMVFIVSRRKAHSTLRPKTVESRAASIGWSYCGVNSIAKTISSGYLAYKCCAHQSHFWVGQECYR